MAHSHASTGQGREGGLKVSLALTSVYLVAEVVGGLLTGSLALLSDAAHMLTDVASVAIALVAIRLGRRPADARRTFGYYRFEILAAATNAAALFAVAAYILYEAYHRLRASAEVAAGWMLGVALAGLIHVWAITSGRNSLTAHLVVDADRTDLESLRQNVEDLVKERFGTAHTTIQMEVDLCRRAGPEGHGGCVSRAEYIEGLGHHEPWRPAAQGSEG